MMGHAREPNGSGASGGRRSRRLGSATVAASVLAVVAVLTLIAVLRPVTRPPGSGTPGAATTRQPGTGSRRSAATVTIAAAARLTAVPRSFLGLSTEYWTVPAWTRHMLLARRVLSLLAVNGPIVLRIGGDSADHTFWAPSQELPEWAFELTPSWLRTVRQLVARSGIHLILDLNLVTATPRDAALWARVAEAALPGESIIGFEIGNEPDIYSHSSWLSSTSGGARSRTLPRRITAANYATVFGVYARALERVDPGVPLFGPALAEPSSHLRFVSTLLRGQHRGLRAITVHRYPYSQCATRGARTFPSIARVLSEHATAGMAQTIRPALALARRAGVPLRLTEMNSVTCGGRRGVSDTFATALWAPDALFEMLHAGAASASIHVRADAINEAFSLTARGLIAHPLLYGMTLFARTLGSDPQLVPLTLRAGRALHLKAWAVRVRGDELNVLLIDKGARNAHVTLALPAGGPGKVQRLLAPSVRARSRVTLGGQRLGADARWVGRRRTETVTAGTGGYALTVGAMSAALVTVRLRAGALSGAPVG